MFGKLVFKFFLSFFVYFGLFGYELIVNLFGLMNVIILFVCLSLFCLLDLINVIWLSFSFFLIIICVVFFESLLLWRNFWLRMVWLL